MVKVKKVSDVKKEGIKDVPGVKIQWVWAEKDGVPNFYFRVFEVEPGKNTPYHQHEWEHEVYVLEGEGVVKTDGEEHKINPGTSVYVPPNEFHQFVNTGNSILKFICIIPKSKY